MSPVPETYAKWVVKAEQDRGDLILKAEQPPAPKGWRAAWRVLRGTYRIERPKLVLFREFTSKEANYVLKTVWTRSLEERIYQSSSPLFDWFTKPGNPRAR